MAPPMCIVCHAYCLPRGWQTTLPRFTGRSSAHSTPHVVTATQLFLLDLNSQLWHTQLHSLPIRQTLPHLEPRAAGKQQLRGAYFSACVSATHHPSLWRRRGRSVRVGATGVRVGCVGVRGMCMHVLVHAAVECRTPAAHVQDCRGHNWPAELMAGAMAFLYVRPAVLLASPPVCLSTIVTHTTHPRTLTVLI